MLNRRGFIGALTGLPVAAVVQPRISAPEIVAAPTATTSGSAAPVINITINGQTRPLTARDRDELARIIGDSLTRNLRLGRR